MARIATDPMDIATLAVHLAHAFPKLSAYSAASLSAQLHALERKVRREAEAGCSEPRTEKQEKRAASAIRHATALWLAELAQFANLTGMGDEASYISDPELASASVRSGVRIDTQGDPRGCVLLLTLPGHSEPLRI